MHTVETCAYHSIRAINAVCIPMALNTHTDHRFSNEPSRSASLSFQISSGGRTVAFKYKHTRTRAYLTCSNVPRHTGCIHTCTQTHIHTHTGKSQAKGLGIFTGQDDKIAYDIDIWWVFLSLCCSISWTTVLCGTNELYGWNHCGLYFWWSCLVLANILTDMHTQTQKHKHTCRQGWWVWWLWWLMRAFSGG